jgi:hypothetical protein
MHAKTGQVTIFIILGLVLVASIGVFLFYQTPEEQQIPETIDKASVTQYVNTCLKNVAENIVAKISMQGGMYNPIVYRTYEGNNISYWCYGESPNQCVNAVLTKEDIAGQIIYGIKQEINSCLDFQAFEDQGYAVTKGALDGTAVIQDNEIDITLTYPLKIKKSSEVTVDSFQAVIPSSLGALYTVAHDIINSEAEHESFNTVSYTINHTSIQIKKSKPYPAIIYTLTKEDTILQFAVQGVETVGSDVRFGMSEPLYGCCYVDSVCYANTPSTVCTQKNGIYESLPCSCDTAQLAIPEQCNGQCADCKSHKNGESWCEYDAQTGEGKDVVGSRQYLYSCINGEVVHEECRDYREEICVEAGNKAVCRPNRWQDCTVCTTEQCCENTEERDCHWQNNVCTPYVPPGFKFWEYNGLEYCSLANTQQTCSGLSCSQEAVDAAAIICYSHGDCGNYKNVKGILTTNGFFTSNFKYEPSEEIYDIDQYADPLALPMTVQKQKPLMTQPITQAADIFVEMITAAYRFVNQWVDITVPNYLNPFTKNPKIEVVEVSFCMPWQAPNTAQYCSGCGSGAKPCTEYWCKSLGKKCVYEENNGYPRCTEVSKEKQKPFSMSVTQIPSAYTATEKTLAVQDIKYQGYTITPALVPYSLFTIGINTSVQSICHIDYAPKAEYFDQPVFVMGNAEYAENHVLTMRVPPQIIIPQKLKESLNLTTAEQIVHAFIEPEELLENYETKFPAVFSVYNTVTGNDLAEELAPSVNHLLSLIDDVESSYPYYENLSITLMDKFDKGGYYLFVSCEDRYGNQQEKELFLEIDISNATEDNTPPSIVEFNPDNGATLSESPTIPLTIYTDEPADCHYDASNKPYAEMENAFTCKNSMYDVVAVAGGSYECTTILTETPIYIICADNPGNQEQYAINIQYSNTSGVDGRLSSPYIPENEENPLEEYAEYIAINETENATSIAVSRYLLSEQTTTFNITKENVSVQLYLDDTMVCTLSNATDMQNMACTDSDETNKGEYVCEANVLVTEKQEYTIICKASQKEQNSMESIHYTVTKAEPLKITSIMPANNEEVGKETAVTVSTSSSDSIHCGYAAYGSVEYTAMESIADNAYTAMITSLKQGYNTYTIYCTDSYGNTAEEVVSWYVK